MLLILSFSLTLILRILAVNGTLKRCIKLKWRNAHFVFLFLFYPNCYSTLELLRNFPRWNRFAGPCITSVIECWRREWPARLVWGSMLAFGLLADMRVFARPQISIGCSKSTLETSKCSSGEGYFTCPMANVLSKVKFVLFQCLFRFCSTLVNHLHLFYFFRIRICCHRHFKIMN